MKKHLKPIFQHPMTWILILLLQAVSPVLIAQEANEQEQNFNVYKGKVVDSRNGNALSSAYLTVNTTNISTVTNAEGEFSLKVPADLRDATVTVSHLGYQSRQLPVTSFQREGTRIEMQESVEELSEISLLTAEDPRALVRQMLRKRGDNYFSDLTEMTAFYRESIKKGRRNVSLSEAVVKVHKQPYTSISKDDISVVKARKTADYERLDTLALKLRGGPYNTLYMDVMKDPDFIFGEDELFNFEFSFDDPAKINDRYLYVVNFKERSSGQPYYHGKLFIDAETAALVRASFDLNVDNRKAASNLFVRKKPGGTKVYPTEVHYEIEYREHDGKWYFGYGNTQLQFVVNWKRRFFNSRYNVDTELAVTDWKINPEGKVTKDKTFISPRIVMADDISGFADVAFWGDNNIIEPDKSIQNAIEKIQRQLEKEQQ